MKRRVVICTVGTSLFFPNLSSLSENDETYSGLREAYRRRDWPALAKELLRIDPGERVCGAEINSMASLIEEDLIENNGDLHLCHSSTPDGRDIAQILKIYFESRGWQAQTWEIEGLQDEDPNRFRTAGLRNLAKTISRIVRESGSPDFCAINATGGYKAQIAITVLAGQAIGIPVYYKHERFPIIISLPPLPVALDFRYWMSKLGLLLAIDREQCVEAAMVEEDWDEKMESLIERVRINGDDYIELSPLGIVFLEAFRDYFHRESGTLLPPEIPREEMKAVRLPDHGWGQLRESVQRFLQNVVDQTPYVKEVHSDYLNPDLPSVSRFRLNAKGDIEGIISLRGSTVKYIVLTSATDDRQHEAAVADLNLRLKRGDYGNI
jgi:putative CRISPR-associated protein (TIGR02619 family)